MLKSIKIFQENQLSMGGIRPRTERVSPIIFQGNIIGVRADTTKVSIVRVQCRCHFCIVTMTFTKKLTEEHVRQSSHELMQSMAKTGD
jgi:hypothetical protein